MDEKKFIVYKYTNKINGLIYIGITSKKLHIRWSSGYRNNKRLYEDIIKYGEQNFLKEVLFKNLSFEEASKKEVELIISYKATNPNIGYNIRIIGSAPMLNKKHSKETKKHFSESRKGKGNSFYGKHHTNQSEWKDSHAVICLNTMQIYGTIAEAEKITNITTITNCINGAQLSAGKDENGNKLYWCTYHGENYDYKAKLEEMKKEENKAPRTSKPVKCIETGEIFLSASQASKAMTGGTNASGVARCCRGERKTAHGYHWEYITDSETLSQIQRTYGTKDPRNLLTKN